MGKRGVAVGCSLAINHRPNGVKPDGGVRTAKINPPPVGGANVVWDATASRLVLSWFSRGRHRGNRSGSAADGLSTPIERRRVSDTAKVRRLSAFSRSHGRALSYPT